MKDETHFHWQDFTFYLSVFKTSYVVHYILFLMKLSVKCPLSSIFLSSFVLNFAQAILSFCKPYSRYRVQASICFHKICNILSNSIFQVHNMNSFLSSTIHMMTTIQFQLLLSSLQSCIKSPHLHI